MRNQKDPVGDLAEALPGLIEVSAMNGIVVLKFCGNYTLTWPTIGPGNGMSALARILPEDGDAAAISESVLGAVTALAQGDRMQCTVHEFDSPHYRYAYSGNSCSPYIVELLDALCENGLATKANAPDLWGHTPQGDLLLLTEGRASWVPSSAVDASVVSVLGALMGGTVADVEYGSPTTVGLTVRCVFGTFRDLAVWAMMQATASDIGTFTLDMELCEDAVDAARVARRQALKCAARHARECAESASCMLSAIEGLDITSQAAVMRHAFAAAVREATTLLASAEPSPA